MSRAASLVLNHVRRLTPYSIKETPVEIKLDANEFPYDLSDLFLPLKIPPTNRYPDPSARALKSEASRLWRVPEEMILVGNGSDELIYYLITTFGGPVYCPVPTFSMYGIIATGLGHNAMTFALDEEFQIPVDEVKKNLLSIKPKLIFLSSPNNPTGNCFKEDAIREIIASTDGLVVIDEAYQPFSKKSHLNYLKEWDNVAILRTLSKIGLAGLRVGFLIAQKEVVNEVNKVRLPFNVNSLSQTLAMEALRNFSHIEKMIETVIKERDALYRNLSAIGGLKVFPSEANFILFFVDNAHRVYDELIKRGILLRNLYPEIENALRVTVGKREENERFIEALKEILG